VRRLHLPGRADALDALAPLNFSSGYNWGMHILIAALLALAAAVIVAVVFGAVAGLAAYAGVAGFVTFVLVLVAFLVGWLPVPGHRNRVP
jgi:hypothetical protein